MTKNVEWWCHVTMWSCHCHMTHMYFREHNPFLLVSVVLNYDNISQLILSGKLLQKVYVVNTFSRSQAVLQAAYLSVCPNQLMGYTPPGILPSTHGGKLKLTTENPLGKSCWLVTLSLLAQDTCVFYRLEHIFADISIISKMTPSVNLFCQGGLLVKV